jgi:hypothetical protein
LSAATAYNQACHSGQLAPAKLVKMI